MSKYQISLNQLADFSTSSEAGKKRIIQQQLSPNKFKIPWYQLSKARIKKCIECKGDLKPVEEALENLENKKVTTKRQLTDKTVSIEALKRFVTIKLPTILKKIDYSIVKPEDKILTINGVEIIVAPEVIIKGKLNGQTVFGAVKIHISKSHPFDLQQANYVASTIYSYLQNKIAKPGDIVLPELCICLDIFGARLVKADSNSKATVAEIEIICEEIKSIWKRAAA
jgi:hypothetical protein